MLPAGTGRACSIGMFPGDRRVFVSAVDGVGAAGGGPRGVGSLGDVRAGAGVVLFITAGVAAEVETAMAVTDDEVGMTDV
jgi:hypothetical protein